MAADVWSVTSYKELYRDALDGRALEPAAPRQAAPPALPAPRRSGRRAGVFVAASDYMKALPTSIGRWVPGPLTTLGTDGFGRSETRAALRDFFEVDASTSPWPPCRAWPARRVEAARAERSDR